MSRLRGKNQRERENESKTKRECVSERPRRKTRKMGKRASEGARERVGKR